MPKPKAILLFSGGKDSIYSLQKACEYYEIAILLTSVNEKKDVIYTDGLEASGDIQRNLAQLFQKALGKRGHNTSIELFETSEERPFDDLFEKILMLCDEQNIETIITGDLNHTDGLDKQLISRGTENMGIKVISPAGDFFKKHGGKQYIDELVRLGLEIKIIGTRKNDLGNEYIGETLDNKLIELWHKQNHNFDVAGEDGEYQSLVTNSLMLNQYILIKSFDRSRYKKGRDKKGYFYSRMTNVDYEIVDKD